MLTQLLALAARASPRAEAQSGDPKLRACMCPTVCGRGRTLPPAARARRLLRSHCAVRPLVRRGQCLDTRTRSRRVGDCNGRRTPVGPDGVDEAMGRARLRLLYEQGEAKGRRARDESSLRSLVLLGPAWAPGPNRRSRVAGERS